MFRFFEKRLGLVTPYAKGVEFRMKVKKKPLKAHSEAAVGPGTR